MNEVKVKMAGNSEEAVSRFMLITDLQGAVETLERAIYLFEAIDLDTKALVEVKNQVTLKLAKLRLEELNANTTAKQAKLEKLIKELEG